MNSMKSVNIGLNEDARTTTVEALQKYLANSIALTIKTQGFHWNVEGPHFGPLHDLFQAQYEDLYGANDETAERIRMMGAFAPASLTDFKEAATIADNGGGEHTEVEMLEALQKDHEHLCHELREAIPKVQEGGDEGTADYFIARLQVHEKAAWMLRSHLAGK